MYYCVCENCDVEMELDELTEYQSKTIEIETKTYKCPECGRKEKFTTAWELIDSGE